VRARRLFAVAILAGTVSVAFPLGASGHASDFETLTLDFLFGPKGLEAVDAAVVESKGPGYEPFPASEFKRDIALDVLQSLQVALRTVDIDVEMSERYHEVGFLVRFDAPSLGVSSPLLIETLRLQQIASKARLSRLKLSMCGVTDGGGASDEDMKAELHIQASSAGRPPVDWDREACQVWSVNTTDESFSIVVRREAVSENRRGVVIGTVGALTVILVAAALLVARTRKSADR
jgi:hypothetical protein